VLTVLELALRRSDKGYPWDGYHNGASASAPPKYMAAYRHVHDVFAAAGVTNVLWVFCPNVDSVPGDAWNQWANYYPGDTYVDWMCYDGYDWGTDTFASMTSRIYAGLAAKNKPIMLGETSTLDVEKAVWINAIIPAMKSQFPMLRALVWFDVNKENDCSSAGARRWRVPYRHHDLAQGSPLQDPPKGASRDSVSAKVWSMIGLTAPTAHSATSSCRASLGLAINRPSFRLPSDRTGPSGNAWRMRGRGPPAV
jgi:hypothetical protein